MADGQQVDHYDFINAPQFVDFSDLASQDDPDADKFFETHKEEDDFMIPLDVNNISPTVQLLYNQENEYYSNEANKAAHDAGLEDVKIEYYASPQQPTATSQPSSTNKKSMNSTYATPRGPSECMSQASFYTPTGCNEDKENTTPMIIIPGSAKKSGKDTDKTPRNVLSDNSQVQRSPALTRASVGSAKDTQHNNPSPTATQSLMSRLNQLSLVSSDEDTSDTEIVIHAPTGNEKSSSGEATYDTFSPGKLAYLGIPSETAAPGGNDSKDTVVLETDADVQTAYNVNYSLITSESDGETESFGAAGMEMREPVNHLLKMLDAQLNMDDGEEDPRCSILVAPRVGEQVHWSTGDEAAGIAIDDPHGQHVNLSYDVEDHEHGYSGDSSDEYDDNITTYQPRASSVGDIIRAIHCEPKVRQFETYGYNPRVGITIPKTPDVAQFAQEAEPVAKMEKFNSNMNACYFEIEAPKPSKQDRRVSSCSDLLQLQQQAKIRAPVNRMHKAGSRGLTIPKTPDTMKRGQKCKTTTESNASSATSTSSRNAAPVRTKLTLKGPTVSERLTAARNRQPVKANHYVSMAEAMIKYQKNTPDRFRSLPKGRLVPEKRANSNETRRRGAASPDCSMMDGTRTRAESFSEKSTRSFGNCPTLPKKVDLKPTVPKPFNLSSGTRNRPTTAVPKEEDVVDFKFKARPAPAKPSSVNDTTVLHKSRPQVRVTQPQSPQFASDARLRERHQKKAQMKSPEPKQFVKLQAPRISRPPSAASRHSVDEHKTTVAQPFSSSFDARQKEILRRKEEKIKHELEESKKTHSTFHANPVPKFNAKLPKKKATEPTHVEPFKLKSDERGAAYQEAFKKKLEEEEEHLRELAVFHAQPADVIHKAPFEPERPTRLVEGPMDFQLATERRAAEREQFDEHVREKEREEEEIRREEQERLEEIQKLEDIERRRQMVHKAQPFKPPKPFHLKSSAKPLTVPQSPAFSALPSQRRVKPNSPDSSIL